MEEFPYNDIVMEHIRSPRNPGEMEDPDGVYLAGDPSCGDTLKLFIKVENDVINKSTFQVAGCGAAIASASVTTEMLTGLPVDLALEITNGDVIEKLGGLPPEKIHCSVMAREAIKGAVEDYRHKLASQYAGQDHTYPFLFGTFGMTGSGKSNG